MTNDQNLIIRVAFRKGGLSETCGSFLYHTELLVQKFESMTLIIAAVLVCPLPRMLVVWFLAWDVCCPVTRASLFVCVTVCISLCVCVFFISRRPWE